MSNLPTYLANGTAIYPGDILLYSGHDLFDLAIKIKTWHPETHVEMYVGDWHSIASRNGLGTGIYPLRTEDLAYVCHPMVPFDLELALTSYLLRGHQPYGWFDLLQFIGLNVEGKGIVCSPFITVVSRWGKLDPFNGEPAVKIAPFEFLLPDCYQVKPQ